MTGRHGGRSSGGYRRADELRVSERVECHGHIGMIVSIRGDYGTSRHPLDRVTVQLAADTGGILLWYLEAGETVRVLGT